MSSIRNLLLLFTICTAFTKQHNTVEAFTFDFVHTFAAPLKPYFIDTNTGYYDVLIENETALDLAQIFGSKVRNLTNFTIVSILKFEYNKDEREIGVNVFDLDIESATNKFGLSFYTREEDNKIYTSLHKNHFSADVSFSIPNDQQLANNQWHKIVLEFSKGIYKLWLDCQYIGETSVDENKYEFIAFDEITTNKITLNPKRLFYASANYKLKKLQLISGIDTKDVSKTDCSDVPSSFKSFDIEALESLRQNSTLHDAKADSFVFENSEHLGKELARFHPDWMSLSFDSQNFLVNYEIRFPTTNDADQINNLLDGAWHKLMYTAHTNGEIRVYLDCKFIGNYSLYNMNKNLQFDSPYSAVDTIFQLGVTDLKVEVRSIKIQNFNPKTETVKSICPNLKTQSPGLCSELKKPFKNLNCIGKPEQNWNWNTLTSLKDSPNKMSSPVGDIFSYSGLTPFAGDLAEHNRNFLAPNFDPDNLAAEYILRGKMGDGTESSGSNIYDGKWHKIAISREEDIFLLYFDCAVELGFKIDENQLFGSFSKNLNFGTSDSVTYFPFFGRLDGMELVIRNFTVYSPSSQADLETCTDVKKLNSNT